MSTGRLPLALTRLVNDHAFASGGITGAAATAGVVLVVHLVNPFAATAMHSGGAVVESAAVSPAAGGAPVPGAAVPDAAAPTTGVTSAPPPEPSASTVVADTATAVATGTVAATWRDEAGYKTRATVTIYQRDTKDFDSTANPHLMEAREEADSCVGLSGDGTVYSPVASVKVEDVTEGNFSMPAGAKISLGHVSPAGGGAEEDVLDYLEPDPDGPRIDMIVPDRLLDMDYPCLVDEHESLYGFDFGYENYIAGAEDVDTEGDGFPQIYAQAFDYTSPNRPDGSPEAFDGTTSTCRPTS
jgi:hypothetical protein